MRERREETSNVYDKIRLSCSSENYSTFKKMARAIALIEKYMNNVKKTTDRTESLYQRLN